MKKIKAMICSTFITFSLLPAAFANGQPAACPKIDPIQKAGFTGIQEDKEDSVFVAYQINKYATPETWAFVVVVPADQATTQDDAMNKANAALTTLSGEPEPVATDKDNQQWYCLYQNANEYLTVAVTPISVSNAMSHSIFKLKK